MAFVTFAAAGGPCTTLESLCIALKAARNVQVQAASNMAQGPLAQLADGLVDALQLQPRQAELAHGSNELRLRMLCASLAAAFPAAASCRWGTSFHHVTKSYARRQRQAVLLYPSSSLIVAHLHMSYL